MFMKFPFYGVNAFCRAADSGNPAGVCILNDWLSTDDLQLMANQISMPETAFLFPVNAGNWAIRWFSPIKEVDFCGHATLAAVHVLFEEGLVMPEECIRFSSNAGQISAKTHTNERYLVDFPAVKSSPSRPPPALIEGIGAYPDQVFKGTSYAMCVFSDEEIIQELQPDFRTLSNWSGADGIIVTSETARSDYDFISRFFAPRLGIDEDHATGSAHCQLAPYWSNRLKKDSLIGLQLSPREGEFYCDLKDDRVSLSGSVSVFLRGKYII